MDNKHFAGKSGPGLQEADIEIMFACRIGGTLQPLGIIGGSGMFQSTSGFSDMFTIPP